MRKVLGKSTRKVLGMGALALSLVVVNPVGVSAGTVKAGTVVKVGTTKGKKVKVPSWAKGWLAHGVKNGNLEPLKNWKACPKKVKRKFYKFTSSNKKIATVKDGKISVKGNGKTKIGLWYVDKKSKKWTWGGERTYTFKKKVRVRVKVVSASEESVVLKVTNYSGKPVRVGELLAGKGEIRGWHTVLTFSPGSSVQVSPGTTKRVTLQRTKFEVWDSENGWKEVDAIGVEGGDSHRFRIADFSSSLSYKIGDKSYSIGVDLGGN